ncbi:MAG: hypothetical protein Q4D87_06960 [Actinomycetaceae bacterium]|nr:hypothetical protein [Actinomycetaceae bacterium]
MTPGSSRAQRHADSEAGEATVEFIAMVVVILVPLAYFIFTMASIQSAVFAAEAAARETGRIVATNPSANAHVTRQVDQIFSDYHVDSTRNVDIQCSPGPCATADVVRVRVEVSVDLPLIPDSMRSALVPTVPISANYTMPMNKIELVE